MNVEQAAVYILCAVIGWVLRHYGLPMLPSAAPQSRQPAVGTFPPPAAQAPPPRQ